MKNKTKNPLYVVKGDDVEAANGIFDLLLKKLNIDGFIESVIDPLMEVLNFLFQMLLEQVDSYPKFKAVHDFIHELTEKIFARIALFKNHSFA